MNTKVEEFKNTGISPKTYYECPKCGDYIDMKKISLTDTILCSECKQLLNSDDFKPMVIVYKYYK